MLAYLIFFLILLPFVCALFPSYETQIYRDSTNNAYYIYMWIGTPLIKRTFLIDMNSRMIYLDCKFCGYCRGQGEKLNDFSSSSSLTNVTCRDNEPYCSNCRQSSMEARCQFSTTRDNISLEGYLIKDHIVIAPMAEQKATVASNEIAISPIRCITSPSPKYVILDGILGLSPEFFFVDESTYLNNSMNTSKRQFSLCFSKFGGMFYIGQTFNPQMQEEQVEYQFSESGYQINILDIAVGGIKLNINKNTNSDVYKISIDSKYYKTIFPPNYYNRLISILDQVCSSISCKSLNKNNTKCFQLGNNQFLNRFPNITILTTQSKLEWNPRSYLSKKNNTYCLQIQKGTNFKLGTSWMIHRLITFNIENRTIQISDSNCQDQNYSSNNKEDNGSDIQMLLGLPFETLLLCIILMILLGIIIGVLFKKYWKKRYSKEYHHTHEGKQSKPSADMVEEENAEDVQLGQIQNPTSAMITS